MRILIPTNGFGRSGGYRTLARLATEWINAGHCVSFVTPIDSEPYFPTRGEIILTDYKGNRVSQQCPRCKQSNIKRNLSVVRYIRKHHSEYDIILASANRTAIQTYLGSRKRFYYYVQAYEPEFYPKPTIKDAIKRSLASVSYKLPAVRVANADIYKDYKTLHCDHVVPPGLDLDVYYPKEDNHWKNSRPLVIGCIGRTEEWKGSADVAAAVDILLHDSENVRFVVAFNPVDCSDYELVKPDGDENLAEYYRSLDVLIAPGKLQLGAVHYPVIEAMACNTCVITTGYYPANNSNSYIVPVSSPEAIATTVRNIMSNFEEARAKTHEAQSDIQRFDWKTVSRDFLQIFERAEKLSR